jgi:drug/metabolite transporter (DMT)-like permease
MNIILIAQMFALLAAFGFATGDVAARYGLRTSTPISGILIMGLMSILFFGPFALVSFRKEEIQLGGILIFLIAGIAAPGLAATFHYMSFRRIGLSRTVAIAGSAPLITVILAVATLGERPKAVVYLGTLLIVFGVIFLAKEQRSASRQLGEGKSVWHYFVFAALGTLLFAIATTLRKVGISRIPNLSVALSVSGIGTLLIILLLHPILPREERIRLSRQNIWFFVASGGLSSLGHLAFFAALQRGPLSIVAPLVFTTPLFALFFSWIFFREIERLNLRLVTGALLICLGAALVTVSRG